MENRKKIVLTGDRPTGRLHLGHYAGSLLNRVKFQHEYNQFIMIADMQALTDNAEYPEKVRKDVLEVALDYFAVGLEPNINTVFIQSLVPELAELTMYYLNLVTLARLQRNPTVKNEMEQKRFGGNVPVGFLIYPVSQAADITAFKGELVPVGEDQLPMIEQTNEVVRRFNNLYNGQILVECKAVVSRVTRLPGTDGKTKMGKSLNNAIYLSDSSDVIQKKVMGMFTDPDHIRAEDPGKIENNPVFAYLNAFDPDKITIDEMKAHYQRGGLGDIAVKKHLNEVLQELLKPIRKKRQELEKHPEEIMKILKTGSEKAQAVAEKTLKDVRRAMRLDYF